MTEAAPIRKGPPARRPWLHWARCVACRLPIGARDASMFETRGGLVLMHEDCIGPKETWS